MTNPEENRKIVWDACVKANPAKVWVEEAFDEYDGTIEIHTDPTAADVLLALQAKYPLKKNRGAFDHDLDPYESEVLTLLSRRKGNGAIDLRATLSSWDEATVAALAALLKPNE